MEYKDKICIPYSHRDKSDDNYFLRVRQHYVNAIHQYRDCKIDEKYHGKVDISIAPVERQI